jgi:hypothetical protein
MLMTEQTNKELMKHDSDVAGSLLVLLGEGWKLRDKERENRGLKTVTNNRECIFT